MGDAFEQFLAQARGIGLLKTESDTVFLALKGHSSQNPVRNAEPEGLTGRMEPGSSDIGAAKKVSLSRKESEVLEKNIAAFVASKPVKTDRKVHLFTFFSLRTMPAIAVVVAVVVGVGGVSAAAGQSLPGDFLYPIKINVNESIQAAFKTSTEAKAKFDAKRAELRMEEAAKLAAAGRLDDRVEEDLSSRASLHLQHAQEHVASLEEEGDAKAAEDVRAAISEDVKAHADVMQDLSTRMQSDIQARVKKILSDVSAKNQIFFGVPFGSSSSSSLSSASFGRRSGEESSVRSHETSDDDAAASVRDEAHRKFEDRFKKVLPEFFSTSSSSSGNNSSSAVSSFSGSSVYHSEYHSSGPNGSVDIEVHHESHNDANGHSDVHVDSNVNISTDAVNIHLP